VNWLYFAIGCVVGGSGSLVVVALCFSAKRGEA
jgi:hypothetical protein